MPIQSQGIITRDNVSVDVSAVAYYRVDDAVRSVVAIENVSAAINQIAQTTLRAVVGRHTLDETLSETDAINQNIREILDVQTEEWGVKVTVVELKDIQLPDSMQRAMARQAEAEREKRAKIIAAEGEALAAGELGERLGRDDGPPAGAAAAQPPDDGRDRRRQELHDHVPGTADEHDRRDRHLPQPRGGSRSLGAASDGRHSHAGGRTARPDRRHAARRHRARRVVNRADEWRLRLGHARLIAQVLLGLRGSPLRTTRCVIRTPAGAANVNAHQTKEPT